MIKKIILFSMLSVSLMAAENQVPSCYEKFLPETKKPAVQQELFVVIDQTTIMDSTIQKQIFVSVEKFIKPGNAVTVVTYSSNIDGRYMETPFSGVIETNAPQDIRDDQPKKVLRNFDRCLHDQYAFTKNHIGIAMLDGFKNSTSNIPKSDIFKSFSQMTQYAMKDSKAKEKIVIISSDMLENSSITSFYQNGGLKSIDPDNEMNKFKKCGLNANFCGARVYVIGAATTPGKNYHDPKMMQQLKSFWSSYFSCNNAKLIEFGEPMLMGTVH